MDLELLYDRAQLVGHADLGGLVPATATLVLRRADGVQLQAPVVTLPTAATTVAAGTTTTELEVANAAGLAVGQELAVTSGGVTYVVTPTRIENTKLYLAAALPVAPSVGSPVAALRMTATLTAVGIAELGAGLQLEWRYDDGTSDGYATAEVAVVRWLWQPPLSGGEVAELLATVYQATRSDDFCRGVADRVNTKVRNAIEQTGRRPYLYVAPGAFAEVAQVGVRWVLADQGIGLVGDLAGLAREYRFAFNDEMIKVVASLKGYDKDNDGKITVQRNVLAIPMVR